jgi:sialidase-1
LNYTHQSLFVSGSGGYHTYRIPAIIVTNNGTLLAFCEGRKTGGGDAGHIDLLLKRSFDNGHTWTNQQVIVDGAGDTAGNPAPVVDRQTGKIVLLFCHNLGDGGETLITQGQAPRTVWMTSSQDDGQTWADPVEITDSVKRPDWTWYATGPVHGIQLEHGPHRGRLIVPCDHMVGIDFNRQTDPYHSHLIYSDDGGQHWHIGGIAQNGTNECTVVETVDGSLYLNSRNYVGEKRRVGSWSRDQGLTLGEGCWEETLIEPICQAGMVRYNPAEDDQNLVLFANPASVNREQLRVKVSRDECRTWDQGRLIHAGPAAYSDLVIAPNGLICCFYERGDDHPYQTIAFDQFDLEWLMEAKA